MSKNRIGEEVITNKCGIARIVSYKNASKITAMFSDGYERECAYADFKRGKVTNPYHPTVYGAGYSGVGEHEKHINKKSTRAYSTWKSMLKRCYSKKSHEENPTYKDCEVCEEWHNFQNFAEWFYGNYYEVEDKRMELDKDILTKGNKTYNPKNCVFVPNNINSLFVKRQLSRGDCPIGVSYDKKRDKYTADLGGNRGKLVRLGRYGDVPSAFHAYKVEKEKLIKSIAEDYKDKIPNNLYKAMVNYKVEITD